MVAKFKIHILLLLLVLRFCPAFAGFSGNDTLAKNAHRDYNIEPKYHYGFILPHHPLMRYFIIGHVQAFQLDISKNTFGNKAWQRIYRYPAIGIGYYLADLGNPQVLGYVNAIYSFYNVPIVRARSFTFNYQMAFGFSYLTKKFDKENNYINRAIGSRGNVYFNFELDLKIRLTRRLELRNGLGITHFSNGALCYPNLGINVVAYNIGLRYNMGCTERTYINPPLPEIKEKNEYSVYYCAGLKGYRDDNNRLYSISSLNLNYERILNPKRRVGAGLDFFYDQTLEQSMINVRKHEAKTVDLLRSGFHVSNDLVVNKVSLLMQMGVYIYNPHNFDGRFYHRWGLRYKFLKHIAANISLKTHFFKADFIEWGLGYYWN